MKLLYNIFGIKTFPQRAQGIAELYESFGPKDRAQGYATFLLGTAFLLKDTDMRNDHLLREISAKIYTGEFVSDVQARYIKRLTKRYGRISDELRDSGGQFNRLLAAGINLVTLALVGGYDIEVVPPMIRTCNAIAVHDEDAFGRMYTELHLAVECIGLNTYLSQAYSVGMPMLYIPV